MTLAFEDIEVGSEVPVLNKGPITTGHMMRWSAAMENWHKIHYDWKYATEHDKLPDVLISGAYKQNVLIQLLSDWVGETGWLWKLAFQFRGMNLPNETLTAWGRVTEKRVEKGYGVVSLEVGLRNDKGAEGTPGTAVVVVPLKGGAAVPYPFNPAVLA
ncbi:acyl dehydratase [Rhizobium sp. AN80A]|uniref:acyl dehydratase n=1 Tax=Rhizobium sp. AN80A TaxID=3040673 RepID=UPI0024B3BE92|nr:acyl dehydratase [Rhizobium sp. AN80A]